jgi:uncharacterized protein
LFSRYYIQFYELTHRHCEEQSDAAISGDYGNPGHPHSEKVHFKPDYLRLQVYDFKRVGFDKLSCQYSDFRLEYLSMYQRQLNILKTNSFFLFGARGTGKSTLLDAIIPKDNTLWINLLSSGDEESYQLNPDLLSQRIAKLNPEWVVIDEVQKIPKLLDVVHKEIEEKKIKFALTGSSARKLKRGGANLLAGRAFVNNLYPLTSLELRDDFSLDQVINWGSLPAVCGFESALEKKAFLKAYVDTYLKEEILQEQIVRNVVPFRKFLQIASQSSGAILNLSRIAKDINADWSTVRSYFEILEDTLLGFYLPAYDKSVRKQQLKSGKFYLFDLGVKKALDGNLSINIESGQLFGPMFEHFIILEIYRLNDYLQKDFKLSFLATQGGLEIDLVIERPSKKTLLIEIKSSKQIREDHLRHLKLITEDFPDDFEAVCLCQESHARDVAGIKILPWREGLSDICLS